MVLVVSKPERDQMPFRLAPDVMRRLDRTARRRGQTRQAFVEGAVLAELAADEERRQMFKKDDTPSEVGRSSSSPPVSLLSQALLHRREEPAAPSSTIGTPQGQVVVNVGGAGGGGSAPSGDIERLANYVASGGNEMERETRLRTAVTVLHTTASSDEERKVLAARLDEAVAAKTKMTPSHDGAGGIVRTARVAYDKIADLWEKM